MSMQKCISWLGHDYRARYDKSASNPPPMRQIRGDAEAILETFRSITYVYDICTRCGHVVNRKDS